jgi:ankyrin repeat protein
MPSGHSCIFHLIRGALCSSSKHLFEDTRSFEEAEQKYESCLKLLLKSGADVESLDQDGDTPLHMCVKVRVTQLTLQIGRLLLEHGATP